MSCAADKAVPSALEIVEVVANDRVTEGVGLLVFEAPRVAAAVRPGQFVHLRVASGRDFILRRPFSVHRRSGTRIEILYQVLGIGTRAMSLLEPGDMCDVIGPLGTGWTVSSGLEHVLFVTGGLGAAPMGMLAEELSQHGTAITVAMGAPSADRLVARELFEDLARRVEIATDDGTAGWHGFVTLVSQELLSAEHYDRVYCCGPEAMQHIVAAQCRDAAVECEVSLERLMACGIGACLSCVVTTTAGLKRACVDGPVFNAADVVWDRSEIPPKH